MAIRKMKQSKQFIDGHYQLSLPWKPGASSLSSNRSQAEARLWNLRKRLEKDDGLKRRYTEVMNSYLDKKYAYKADPKSTGLSEDRWYLPHHAVLHPKKPEKVRVVFDCSASFRGKSLNQQLLQGPDLLNSLIGVLRRFRKGEITLVGDIEAMFHQVRVDPRDHNYLRFLWWPGGNLELPPEDYCVQVHLFGATSSPSRVNYCLLETAKDNRDLYNPAVQDTVKRNFYMDDCLMSLADEEEALYLYSKLTKMLADGGFRLTKCVSNNERVLDKIPVEERSTSVLDLNKGVHFRVLGVKWDFKTDDFQIETFVKEKPATRRGVLSVVSSLFDPLGFVTPVILEAKILLQNLTRQKLGWDDSISDDHSKLWDDWLRELEMLQRLKIPRFMFFSKSDKASVQSVVFHHFADASSQAYAVVTYARIVDCYDNVSCSFIFGKSRLAPIKTISIPWLKLMAAVLAVKIDQMLLHELEISPWNSVYWSDSTAVLQMIRNTNKRFPVFVSNRLTKIEEHTSVEQWKYVTSKQNPADVATRGIDAATFVSSSQWLDDPEFLKRSYEYWPKPPCSMPSLSDEFASLKTVCTSVVRANPVSMDACFSRFSCWHRLKKVVAWILR